jgi:hypothetical protein
MARNRLSLDKLGPLSRSNGQAGFLHFEMPTTRHITKAFQWDLARQVERLDFLLKWLPRYADWGYQELYLHLEDAVEYPSLPGVARPDAYSYKQFTRLVEAATKAGIGVVPIVNLLGHTQYLIKTPELRDLNELRDAGGGPLAHGQICPLHPRTLEIADKLLRDMAPFCTTGKVHVGLDESFHLGKCPRCQADIERRGLAAHFAGHVGRLHQLATSRGLRMGMWADMLALLPAAIPLLPRDVIAYDWYYYPFARHPRAELRNFAEIDLATPLQKRGIEYWGCPMNGAFRYEPMPVFGDRLANILSWWKRCSRVGASGFLVTSWEANRLAIELATVVDAAAACLWLEPGIEEPREMLARGFARVLSKEPFGSRRAAACRQATLASQRPGTERLHMTEARRFARAALACDDYAFVGYHRWQINDRWDVCAARGGAVPYEREEKKLAEICRRLSGPKKVNELPQVDLANQHDDRDGPACPTALAASLAFRLYLAKRDVFVRRAAEGVFQLRRLRSAGRRPASDTSRRSQTGATFASLRAEASAFAAALRTGRAAARAMWARSRDPRVRGPNDLMLDRDVDRLREWTHWLQKAGRNPSLVWQATPVCGAWQLQFTVHNFAPALQKVVVEQQQPDGSWETIYGLHTIEFRAFAARPHAKISREFSVPCAENAETLKAERLKQEGSSPSPRFPDLQVSGSPGFPLFRFSAFPLSFSPLRIAVRGVGQVGISLVELTDGVTRLPAHGLSRTVHQVLGRPAPQRGFPKQDF